jgi:tetratricopeptide (TPR) repeat protein
MKKVNSDNPEPAAEKLLHFLETGKHRPEMLAGPSTYAGECYSPEAYVRVALGEAESNESQALLAHAASCANCCELLARSLRALDGEPSAEELAAIAELAAARTDWQLRMAGELAATPARTRSKLFDFAAFRHSLTRRILIGSAVAASLAVAAGLFAWRLQSTRPERLLAVAYTQSRTMELRIPLAAFASQIPGRHTRGAIADGEPPALLEARARLAESLQRKHDDTHMLELQARADLLEERYDTAADTLDRLLAEGPVTSELLVDASSAYFQRGLVSGSASDRGIALDYIRRADELAPADPLVLFNEAIMMEDRGQMMNAVEVWHRFITVERDPGWTAEGQRKLTTLEQTLNRLKTHQSRMEKMLATPESMDGLADNAELLGKLDEELSTLQLNKILKMAYPTPASAAGAAGNDSSAGGQNAAKDTAVMPGNSRGSPCDPQCAAARRLLHAIARSLELKHHDFWLSDLLSPEAQSPSSNDAAIYTRAILLLGKSIELNWTGFSDRSGELSTQAKELFLQLKQKGGPLAESAALGAMRAQVEHLFSMQLSVNFKECRSYAADVERRWKLSTQAVRYPWMTAQEEITEKVCDDTPDTRTKGLDLQASALRLAQASDYPLLVARIKTLSIGDAQNAGDSETADRVGHEILRSLYSQDPPPIRIASAIASAMLGDLNSPLAHLAELNLAEAVPWFELAGDKYVAAVSRMHLARAELRIGAVQSAENQVRQAQIEGEGSADGKHPGANFSLAYILLADTAMERGDLAGAAHDLLLAKPRLTADSDAWMTRMYSAAEGQLELSENHFEEAAALLESDIHDNEGRHSTRIAQSTAAEYGSLDHDLYAELAAVWLAQGRPATSVLAMWERFRLRSHGLPFPECPNRELDCGVRQLVEAQHRLGSDLVTGQIVLLDRVLVYRMDRNEVIWSQTMLRRQEILDAARNLERAVSSRTTRGETVALLGGRLAEVLLPRLPENTEATLLLEPDPNLANLSWPVLPVHQGSTQAALGLQYPIEELRSILSPNSAPALNPAPFGRGTPPRTLLESPALVVGASVAEGEPPLPEALDEARAVSANFHAPALLLGAQATRTGIQQALSSATIFHFAGHAIQTSNGTQLLLARGSAGETTPWIDGVILRQHPPRNCQLAVLSGCSSGGRLDSWSDPLQDMVETLNSVGVPEVVATRWQIDSGAAVPFMEAFYRSLAKGNSVAAALRDSRRVLYSDATYRNPYFWGAYYASGNKNAYAQGALHASREIHHQKGKES